MESLLSWKRAAYHVCDQASYPNRFSRLSEHQGLSSAVYISSSMHTVAQTPRPAPVEPAPRSCEHERPTAFVFTSRQAGQSLDFNAQEASRVG